MGIGSTKDMKGREVNHRDPDRDRDRKTNDLEKGRRNRPGMKNRLTQLVTP